MERPKSTRYRSPVTESPRITAALVDFELHVDDDTRIRLLRTENADVLYDLTISNREHLAPWLTWVDDVIDVSDTYNFLRIIEKEAYDHTSFTAGIWRGERIIGAVSLHDIDWPNARAALGYWLDREHTGRGIMTRAARVLAEYAFEALDLHRIEIRAAVQNAASRRIPERLGFTLEGVLHDVQRIRGKYVDYALYALVRAD